MSDNTAPTHVVDLITRILGVDLSTPRNLDFKPVPEGHIVLGTLSENAQKAFCSGFELAEEISAIEKVIADAVEAYSALHMSEAITDGAYEEHHMKMASLSKKVTNLESIEDGLASLVASMVQDEFPDIVYAVDSFAINEGFVVSKNPAPQEKLKRHIIVIGVNISKSRHSEQTGDANQEPSETVTNQPTKNSSRRKKRNA